MLCPCRVTACALPDTLLSPMKRATLSKAEALQAPARAEGSEQPCFGAEVEEPPALGDAVGSIRAGLGLPKVLPGSLAIAGIPTWPSLSTPSLLGC